MKRLDADDSEVKLEKRSHQCVVMCRHARERWRMRDRQQWPCAEAAVRAKRSLSAESVDWRRDDDVAAELTQDFNPLISD